MVGGSEELALPSDLLLLLCVLGAVLGLFTDLNLLELQELLPLLCK